jgi:hypothetical protein
MRAAGVELTVATAEPLDDTDDSYTVSINGTPCLIAESRSDASSLDATVKPLAQLNTLLAGAGSPLRWHTLQAGGNDGWALLIEPSVADLMTRSGLFEPTDIPSEPPAMEIAAAAAAPSAPPATAASDTRGRGWFRRGGRG